MDTKVSYHIKIEGGYLNKLLIEKTVNGVRVQTGECDFSVDALIFDVNSTNQICGLLEYLGIKSEPILISD